jgi:hypothetical protein
MLTLIVVIAFFVLVVRGLLIYIDNNSLDYDPEDNLTVRDLNAGLRNDN